MNTIPEQNTIIPAVKNRKVYFSITLLVIIIAGLMVSLNLAGQKQEIRKKAAGNGVILGISPATLTVAPNDTITVGITVNTGDETISAVELHLKYDAAKLEAQNIIAGSYLPVVLSAGGVGGGNASIILGSQPGIPQKGSGILASVTFKALSPSSSIIDFDSTTQVAAIGKTGNVLQSSSGSQVTVNPSASSTPATTPTVRPIPTTSACVVARPCLFYSTPCTELTPVQGYCPTPTQIPVTITISPLSIITSTAALCQKKSQGDANCDGKIDGIDYSIWVNTQCHSTYSQHCGDLRADFNGDGSIDDNDIFIWYQSTGK